MIDYHCLTFEGWWVLKDQGGSQPAEGLIKWLTSVILNHSSRGNKAQIKACQSLRLPLALPQRGSHMQVIGQMQKIIWIHRNCPVMLVQMTYLSPLNVAYKLNVKRGLCPRRYTTCVFMCMCSVSMCIWVNEHVHAVVERCVWMNSLSLTCRCSFDLFVSPFFHTCLCFCGFTDE